MQNVLEECRLCKGTHLEDFLSLGEQALTGVFPSSKNEKETYGQLILTKCASCDLIQLKHSSPLNEMYGENYGYRSGLNKLMVSHLQESALKILSYVELREKDLIIDIGSNDGTLLSFFPREKGLQFVGVDPVGNKFREFYLNDIDLITDFFPSPQVDEKYGSKKAKIISSFSCFYDLEDPVQFATDIASRLDSEGVWVLEQSYLPSMIKTLSYDTICHEHLEYYGLKQIKLIAEKAGLKIIDVIFNGINGGSFCVVTCPLASARPENKRLIDEIIQKENAERFFNLDFLKDFASKVHQHKKDLTECLVRLKDNGKTIVALGASTKGNVVLQFCHLDTSIIDAVGEVNPFKYSRFTPGTKIPILSEEAIRELHPDYKLILPWHFRQGFIDREAQFLKNGGSLIFAFPKIEIVSRETLSDE